MINSVVLVGRLTKEVELRKTQTGMSVVSFSLAVDRTYKKEGQPEADFINCIAWDKKADLMNTYLGKGSMIGVEGHIQVRSYQNQQGQKVYITEVVVDQLHFLDTKKPQQTTAPQQNAVVDEYADLPF